MRLVKKIILLVAVVTIHSCDYLDVPPINIIQDDAIFKSESGIILIGGKIGRAHV